MQKVRNFMGKGGLVNGPSTTGKPSGGARSNNPPRSGVSKLPSTTGNKSGCGRGNNAPKGK